MNKLKPPVGKGDHIRGDVKASITLVEYGDYECPYCKEAYPEIKGILRKMKDKLRFIYRNFPLSEVHPRAKNAAWAAEAAALQGKFWEMHDILFENQEALEESDFLLYAKEIGINEKEFLKDLYSNKVQAKVAEDFMSGARSGVGGTPTFFLNGRKLKLIYQSKILFSEIERAASVI